MIGPILAAYGVYLVFKGIKEVSEQKQQPRDRQSRIYKSLEDELNAYELKQEKEE